MLVKKAVSVVARSYNKAKKNLFGYKSYQNNTAGIYSLQNLIDITNKNYIHKQLKNQYNSFTNSKLTEFLSRRKLVFILPKKPIKNYVFYIILINQLTFSLEYYWLGSHCLVLYENIIVKFVKEKDLFVND